jgi:phospholipid/cholesterol/gamma-HCH transport system permease protein
LPRSYLNYWGRRLLRLLEMAHGLGAFALITLVVMVTKLRVARKVIRPLILGHLYHAGFRLLPMVLFLAAALGLVVIGQSVSLLSRVGVNNLLGTVMVTVVVRELGPLFAALLVLLRIGTATVIELGTARALGEIEALEVLGIDPIHYLVVPRVIGMALGIFALTVYLILGALLSGYLWAFLQDVPLTPGDYFRQLAQSLRGLDFILLAIKTCAFGSAIAIVTCYHGLAQPLRLEQVSEASVQAVTQAVVVCVLVDALFIIIYLVA